MDLKLDDSRTRQFVTNVGLITSYGRYGYNVMAAEWTHHISYSPSLIAVCINPDDATAANIAGTKEFGVNLASSEQNVLSSIAGNYTGKEVDKIKVLKELGFEFVKAKKIKPLMVKGAVMSAECKLVKKLKLGDHIMFIGEVVEIYSNLEKQPIIYSNGKYWKFGEKIEKPSQTELEKINKLIEKFKK